MRSARSAITVTTRTYGGAYDDGVQNVLRGDVNLPGRTPKSW
jgi:hypothetical protein